MLIDAPYRGTDRHGSGAFMAPRAGGRTHKGIDFACYQGSIVHAASSGRVTKIGYPYNPNDKKKGHLRYVEITDVNDFKTRYFYLESFVEVGQIIYTGDLIGATQGLSDIYPGITDHFHFEG